MDKNKKESKLSRITNDLVEILSKENLTTRQFDDIFWSLRYRLKELNSFKNDKGV